MDSLGGLGLQSCMSPAPCWNRMGRLYGRITVERFRRGLTLLC